MQPKRIDEVISKASFQKKPFFSSEEKKGKFKLKVFFKDGNSRVFYSKDKYMVWDKEKSEHVFIESESYGLQRLQNLIKEYTGKFITALIYTNDQKNIKIEHWAGMVCKMKREVKFNSAQK